MTQTVKWRQNKHGSFSWELRHAYRSGEGFLVCLFLFHFLIKTKVHILSLYYWMNCHKLSTPKWVAPRARFQESADRLPLQKQKGCIGAEGNCCNFWSWPWDWGETVPWKWPIWFGLYTKPGGPGLISQAPEVCYPAYLLLQLFLTDTQGRLQTSCDDAAGTALICSNRLMFVMGKRLSHGEIRNESGKWAVSF